MQLKQLASLFPKITTWDSYLYITWFKVTLTFTITSFTWRVLADSLPNYNLSTRWLGYFIWLWFQFELSVDK